MFKAILDLIAKFIDLLRATKLQQVEDKRADQQQAVQKATQQEQVIDNVRLAQDVRAGLQRDLADHPDRLYDDDGFERK